MNAHASQVLQAALTLAERERAEIAALLMQSLDGDPDEYAQEAWGREIATRLNEIDHGKGQDAHLG